MFNTCCLLKLTLVNTLMVWLRKLVSNSLGTGRRWAAQSRMHSKVSRWPYQKEGDHTVCHTTGSHSAGWDTGCVRIAVKLSLICEGWIWILARYIQKPSAMYRHTYLLIPNYSLQWPYQSVYSIRDYNIVERPCSVTELAEMKHPMNGEL